MAADEVLLEAAVAGVASLRFYGWSEPTASLGYFQPARVLQADPRLAGLPFVRRPSGGATLVHDHEITYALALPPGPPCQTGEPWLQRMHALIAAALQELGVPVRLQPSAEGEPFTGTLCFQHFTPGDLLCGAAKVAGSAQRRQRGALMQHGAILLAASPHAPALPGVRELAGRNLPVRETCDTILRQLTLQTGWRLLAGDWSPDELRRRHELVTTKYTQDAWNRKR
jgi:lipoate-protein ligase A